MPRHATSVLLILLAVPALAVAAGQPPAATAQPHPAVSAHANAVAGQANAARLEACVEASDAFIDQLAKGDRKGATGNFDSQMLTALTGGKLGALWQSLTTKFGKFESRGTPQNMMYQNFAVVTVPLHFQKGVIGARLACGPDGKFAGLHVVPVASSEPSASH